METHFGDMKCYSECPPIWCHQNGFPLVFYYPLPLLKRPYNCESKRQKHWVKIADLWELEILCVLPGSILRFLEIKLLLLQDLNIAILAHWCKDLTVIKSCNDSVQKTFYPRISLDFFRTNVWLGGDDMIFPVWQPFKKITKDLANNVWHFPANLNWFDFYIQYFPKVLGTLFYF